MSRLSLANDSKMKSLPIIHIIGLPGAGKTTLARKLSKALKVPIFRIGGYRAKFSQTPIGEADAWLALFRDLSRRGWRDCILETTGINKRESFLQDGLPFGQIITIKLEAPRKLLHQRIRLKRKREQGEEWLFSIVYSDKHAFVDKCFKNFRSISAHVRINTTGCSKAQVFQQALRELDDMRDFKDL